GLPLAGHKDNHAGLRTKGQMAAFQAAQRVHAGKAWEPFAGLDLPEDELRAFLETVPHNRRPCPEKRGPVFSFAPVPAPAQPTQPTEEPCRRIRNALARRDDELAKRVGNTSPEVTVSTNLGGWVNQRGVFHRIEQPVLCREE